jgi:hypothetical protein
VADQRTTITELVTGLGTLGFADLDEALAARPPEMVSLSPEQWCLLEELRRGGAFGAEFLGAWNNGVAFLAAVDGLRGRRPLTVEWRGAQKQPGDEPVPADLRIDHVFLVSCKYLSHIVTNTSPTTVFDRLLAGGHGTATGATDWYSEVAPEAYDQLYKATLHHLDHLHHAIQPPRTGALPGSVQDLTPTERAELQRLLGKGRWPAALRPAAVEFSAAVAEASAQRWKQALAGADRERVLWRLLRIGSAPYFVLGASAQGSLRLRISTAWDWRQHFRIDDFAVTPTAREQPVVQWAVTVTNRRSLQTATVEGHVEIRWSHGKFAQRPEAKVYLDTPHHRIPGYWPLT